MVRKKEEMGNSWCCNYKNWILWILIIIFDTRESSEWKKKQILQGLLLTKNFILFFLNPLGNQHNLVNISMVKLIVASHFV